MITLVLPIPDRVLSPNARVHWAVKAKAVKHARTLAKLAALRVGRPMWKSVTVQCIVTMKTRRKFDRDNLLSMCKAYFDGIADAGVVVNDSEMIYLPVKFTEPDKENPRLTINIENASE